jgi:hypothetical protein
MIDDGGWLSWASRVMYRLEALMICLFICIYVCQKVIAANHPWSDLWVCQKLIAADDSCF